MDHIIITFLLVICLGLLAVAIARAFALLLDDSDLHGDDEDDEFEAAMARYRAREGRK